jgi:DNA-binding SARP family transcriptional activator
MSYLAHTWARPSVGSAELARWYYLGCGALAHQDWHAAKQAFTHAANDLREHAEWSLLWLCTVASTTIAWRTSDGAAALSHARDAHVLADRLDGVWARAWSLWLLGHLYGAHHQQAEAAACFRSLLDLLDGGDKDQTTLRSLAMAATILCSDSACDPEVLVERLFGLAWATCPLGQEHGLPLDAIQKLDRAPRLVELPGYANAVGQGPLGWLRSMLPRAEPPALPPAPPPTEAAPRGEDDLATDGRAPDLRIYFLGSFEVWLGHCLITQWAGTKSKSLLKLMLTAFPSQLPATSLMDAMWPGVDEELARQRLHTAISELRRVLRAVRPDAGSMIISQGGCYGIDPQARIWIDTVEFERARRAGEQYEQIGRRDLAEEALRAAVSIYRGEFLEEDIFADWPLEQRERIKSEYLTLLTRLGQWAFSAGDYDACLRWGRMTLECDPSREDAHRLLMRSYSRTGQRTMALRQYRQCVDALRRELDAMPEAESDTLYRMLQQGQEI